MQIPQTVLRGGRRDDGTWTLRDRLMLMALTAYEQELCTCGHPMSQSTSDDRVDGYEVYDQVICHACAAMETWRDDKNVERFPGQKAYVRPVSDDD